MNVFNVSDITQVERLDTTHYIIGSAIGPHPFPTIVRTFQSVIGNETKEQMQRLRGKLPDAGEVIGITAAVQYTNIFDSRCLCW